MDGGGDGRRRRWTEEEMDGGGHVRDFFLVLINITLILLTDQFFLNIKKQFQILACERNKK